MQVRYLIRSEVYETTPVDFPIGWGEASVARLRTLHPGAFMVRLSSDSGQTEAYLGIKLETNEARRLAGPIPMRFRLGAVAVPAGVIVVFAFQFRDDEKSPLNSEHLVDPASETDLRLLSDMLSQKRWLLPILDETGDIVVVKFIRHSRVLADAFEPVRGAALEHRGSEIRDWQQCQLAYDRACQSGHMFA
jgi:hypothetical protein